MTSRMRLGLLTLIALVQPAWSLRPALAQAASPAAAAAPTTAPKTATATTSSSAIAFTAIAKVLVRSPDPFRLAEFYQALGFKEVSRS